MTSIELCHLGEHCAPGILINDILKIKKKTLFMLGTYTFNNILRYLYDCNYENIYNKQHFTITSDNYVEHILYNFKFNHDYQLQNSEIINYEFIRDRFNIKIKNFREMLSNESMCIFITFTTDVDNLKIKEMLHWLSLNKKNFHLIIFTNSIENNIYIKNLSIICLKNRFDEWYLTSNRTTLYKEIHQEFINCLKYYNIEHNFPLTTEEEFIYTI